jgi:hypothetical protein
LLLLLGCRFDEFLIDGCSGSLAPCGEYVPVERIDDASSRVTTGFLALFDNVASDSFFSNGCSAYFAYSGEQVVIERIEETLSSSPTPPYLFSSSTRCWLL